MVSAATNSPSTSSRSSRQIVTMPPGTGADGTIPGTEHACDRQTEAMAVAYGGSNAS